MRLNPVACAVAGLSMVLSACGGAGAPGGGDEPKEPERSASSAALPSADADLAHAAIVVPLAGDMPEPLKLTRATDFYGELQGTEGSMGCPESEPWCEGVRTGGMSEYGTELFAENGGEYARFEVWEYRTRVTASAGYDQWKKEFDAKAKGFLAVGGGRFGEDVAGFSDAAGNEMGVRAMVSRQGKYVGIVRTYTKADIAPGSGKLFALHELTKLLAERMRQADQNRAPSASAAHIKLS